MVGKSLAVAVLVSVIGAAQASVPKSPSSDATTTSDLEHAYIVFFEAGNASLTPGARLILHVAAHRAQAMREAKVRVMVSTAEGVTVLSQSRARAVRSELVRDGVRQRSIDDTDRPEDVGYANADPAIRTWLDRSAVVKISPLPNALSARRAVRPTPAR
jgi:outer membrane protein OmpA-like peptidoglycan-associated protein